VGRVERDTGYVIVGGNPPGQHGGQMNLVFGFVYVLDDDRHSPVLSKGSGLGVNFLAWRSWAFEHNRLRLGIPPEGMICGFGEENPMRLGIPPEVIIRGFGDETPNALDRGVYGSKGADAYAHSLIFLRVLR
jgi:hypothetical protein